MKIKFVKLNPAARLPEYQTKNASGADAYVILPAMGEVILPGESKWFNTGIAAELPNGLEIQVRSRSGMAAQGIIVLNSPGTIDADFRGEIKVLLANFSRSPFRVFNGDRVAQFVMATTHKIEWSETNELTKTKRGRKGLGSTKGVESLDAK